MAETDGMADTETENHDQGGLGQWSTQRVWCPLCSGLTGSNRSNSLLTDNR